MPGDSCRSAVVCVASVQLGATWWYAVAVATLLASPARTMAGATTFGYDAAGNLVSVSNTNDDVANCGTIGNACAVIANGAASCMSGECAYSCNAGFGWRDSSHSCIDVTSDSANCGAVGEECAATAHGSSECSQGQCVLACEEGYIPDRGSCVPGETLESCAAAGEECADLAGAKACCSGAACGVADETSCYLVSSDRNNCGAIGHVCPTIAGTQASCWEGACALPEGAPSVYSLAGVAVGGTARRLLPSGAILLEGADLDHVTYVELEDWGWDTVDGTPFGVVSVPEDWGNVMPWTPSAPIIAFAQTASSLEVDVASFQRLYEFDGSFWPSRWYKLRLHYVENGLDAYVVVDVAFSLVATDERAPTITSVAGLVQIPIWLEGLDSDYDPFSGLLALGDLTGMGGKPVAVLGADAESEFPIHLVTPNGVYLDPGLDTSWFAWIARGEVHTVINLVLDYEDGSGGAIDASTTGLLVRGTGLWEGGALSLDNPTTDVDWEQVRVRGLGARFTGTRMLIPSLAAYVTEVEQAVIYSSVEGIAVSSPIRWTNAPKIETFDGAPYVSVGQTVTLTGAWLERGGVTHVSLEGVAVNGVDSETYEITPATVLSHHAISFSVPPSSTVALAPMNVTYRCTNVHDSGGNKVVSGENSYEEESPASRFLVVTTDAGAAGVAIYTPLAAGHRHVEAEGPCSCQTYWTWVTEVASDGV